MTFLLWMCWVLIGYVAMDVMDSSSDVLEVNFGVILCWRSFRFSRIFYVLSLRGSMQWL